MNKFNWTCPLCESGTEHHEFFSRVTGKIFTGNGYAPVPVLYAICNNCGMVFHWYAMDEQEQYNYYSGQYRSTIQGGDDGVTERVLNEQSARVEYLLPEIADNVGNVGNVLDIGSSTGLLLKSLRDKYNCGVLGVEPGEKFRAWAKKELDIKMLSDVSILHHEHKNAFDLITMVHVLEHLSNPTAMLLKLHDFIADNGMLVIEVPDMFNEYNLSVSHPLAFSVDTLTMMLERTGWKVVLIKGYHGFKVDRPEPSNILVFATPGAVVERSICVDIEQIKETFYESQGKLREYDLQRQAAKR